jgi:hypothetical protein
MQQVAEGRKASKNRRHPPLRTAAVPPPADHFRLISPMDRRVAAMLCDAEYLDGFGTCREFPAKPAWRHKVARVTFTASACGQRSCSVLLRPGVTLEDLAPLQLGPAEPCNGL